MSEITVKYITESGAAEESFAVSNIKEALGLLRIKEGEEYYTNVLHTPHCYVVKEAAEDAPYIPLTGMCLASELAPGSTLFIIPAVEGNPPVIAAAVAYAGAIAASYGFATVGAFLVMYAEIIANVLMFAVSIGVSMLMNSLSPTPEFAADPAALQGKQLTSNLFNGTAIVREQGGPVPLGFGRPFHGGTLISSGLFTEDVDA